MIKDPSHLKKDWMLTKEAFDQLLAYLDADRDRAGEKYESIRTKLVKFFEWRGSPFAEENADETINRVTRKITEGERIDNLQGYFYGVARLLYMEILKEQEKARQAFDHLITSVQFAEEHPEPEPRLACFEACMKNLPGESQRLIIEYYQEDKRAKIEHRKFLAERLKIPLNALRIRIHRLRLQLEECITECLQHPTVEMK